MKVGDLVKIEGGTLRPPWYGEVGIITSLTVHPAYGEVEFRSKNLSWYEVTLLAGTVKTIRCDMLEVVNEGR